MKILFAWRIWGSLLLAPLLALGTQSVLYALVTPSCSHQTEQVLHAVAALSLAICVGLTWTAWREWRRRGASWQLSDADAAPSHGAFIAAVATAIGTLSSGVVLAMWAGVMVLAPCWH